MAFLQLFRGISPSYGCTSLASFLRWSKQKVKQLRGSKNRPWSRAPCFVIRTWARQRTKMKNMGSAFAMLKFLCEKIMIKHTGSLYPSSPMGVNWSMLYLAKALHKQNRYKCVWHIFHKTRQSTLCLSCTPPSVYDLWMVWYGMPCAFSGFRMSVIYAALHVGVITYCDAPSLRRLSLLRRTRTSRKIKDHTICFKYYKVK